MRCPCRWRRRGRLGSTVGTPSEAPSEPAQGRLGLGRGGRAQGSQTSLYGLPRRFCEGRRGGLRELSCPPWGTLGGTEGDLKGTRLWTTQEPLECGGKGSPLCRKRGACRDRELIPPLWIRGPRRWNKHPLYGNTGGADKGRQLSCPLRRKQSASIASIGFAFGHTIPFWRRRSK